MTKNHNGENTIPAWAIDPAEATRRAADFIAATVSDAGKQSVVVGLSGGIDSAVSAALAKRGLGADNVLGLFLPYATSNPDSLADARAVADNLGIRSEQIEITPLVEAWFQLQPQADTLRRGNVMARARMIVLYDLSARDDSLVLGTGNRSEWLLGYTTLYGDNACALNPIGDLYKTEIRLLAAHLELPEVLLQKAPSADLWSGQADEDELGFTYAEADRLLHHLVDEGLGERQLHALGFESRLIERVRSRLFKTAFKRSLPPVAAFPGRPHPDRVSS
ncbi:MAG: NAD+ synthase [bacterium]